ncbi:MAG: beta strand repeat-containing protein, partial [Mycobacterium sp.]|uniref:beta strand repeat-containing protein n=1 Tax=Mycobacterium sp. TaxID=1785 RepID=UPI003F9C0E68
MTVEVVTLGTSASTAYTYNSGPALLFPAPPSGEAGVPYSDQLTVTGGTSPFTWSVSAGSLPPGVTLNASTGLLSGTPTTAGTYSFTVKVADSSGQSNTEAVTLTVIPGPSLSFPAPPSGWTHTVYGDTLTESGGTSPFTWSVSSGSLPSGISLNASGTLSGTPTVTGTFAFTVKVSDANGQSATQATSITVSAGVSATLSAPPAADVGGAYSDTLTATGGTTPYTWSVNAGALPPGLSLSSAGVLAGTPTTAGSYPFTVNVVDANNGIATASITLVVSAGLALSFTAPPNTDVGIGYSDTLTATGGTGPNTWSVSAGSLPAGITLNASTGVLAGTATTAGTSSFTVKVTDAVGQSVTKAAVIVVAARPSLAFPAPPAGQASVAYSDTLTVTGGTGPFAWSVPGGGLPSGLTLNASTGVLSGTPAAAGSFAFTVQVSDAFAVTATEAVTLVIASGPLVIAATASPSPAVPGGTVHFTVTVTNTGSGTDTGATFTDPLADVLDDASYNNNAAATAGTVGFSSPNLTWTGTLAPGASATITFSVTVSSPDTGNKMLASTVTSATAGSNCAAGSGDSRCAVSVPVAVLTISVTPSTTSATPGSTVGYTITVTNSGAVAFTGAALTDPLADVLDDAGYNGDAAATAGSVSYASPNLTWTGNLAAGASATITFSVTVSSPDAGNKTLASTVTSATAGSNCASGSTDPRCASTVTVLIPGLTIAVSVNTGTATPGSVVGYTITVTNSGQTAYTGAAFSDSLSGLLDDASYNGNAAATAGTAGFTSPNLTWSGNLAVGGTATVTFSVTVNNPDTGDKVLAQTVTSAAAGSNCAAGSTDARCSVTVVVLV